MINQILESKPLRLFTDLESGAIFNFFVLTFFTFMGTSLPFQERIIDAYAAETTNVVNQIVFIFLFFSSTLLIIQNPKKTFSFIRKEKYLTAFVLFCVISFLWSDYSLISFKRSFQLYVTFITIINAILYIRLKNLLLILKVVSYLYIMVTFISGLFIPGAIDPEFGTWRGIELQKNLLGHSSLMIFALSIYFIFESNNRFSKYSSVLLLVFSALAIILSGSSTNLIGLLVVVLVILITYLDKYFRPIGVRSLFTNLTIVMIILSSFILIAFSNEILAFIPELFGKDLSFTGRTVIWANVWSEIQKKFWFGYGFGSYWIMGTSVIDLFQASIGNRVNEAHNGFLEIWLQTGIIGFTIFISVMFSFIRRIIKTDFIYALIALLAISIVNFSESFVFKERSPSTLVFIFFYLLTSAIYFHKFRETET